jgi:hypothetical protein
MFCWAAAGPANITALTRHIVARLTFAVSHKCLAINFFTGG